nr:YfhO family protein [Hyphomonas sp. Mor2]
MFHALKSHRRLVVCACLLSVGLLVFHGLTGTPEGNSYKYNLPWFDAFFSAFWQGDLYPRFSPELWYSMGALDFYFYGPLPFWMGSTLGAASCPGCDTATVFSLTGAWIVILSGISFFAFARRFFETRWAGFGAIAYTILPYHYIADWYDRQAVGELTAYIFIPLIALGATKLIEDRKGGVLFALSVAGLAFSHLPSTLIVGHLMAAIVIWAVVQLERFMDRVEMLARFAVWGGLGIALSAIYWVPALGLLGTVSPDMLATDYYDATRWLLLDGLPEITPETSNFVKACLALIVAVTVISGLILKQVKAPNALWLWIIGPSLFAFFCMTVFSYPIWKFWILNKVQFPWRTLIVGELSLALGSIVVARYVVQNWTGAQRLRAQVFAIVSIGLLATAYLVQAPRTLQTLEDSAVRAGTFEPVGTPEYVPPRTLELALTRFRAVANDSHTSEERFYLFFDEMERSAEIAKRAFQDDAPGATLTAHPHDRLTLTATLTEAADIRLPIAAWPYWRAETSDGRMLILGEDEALGLVTIHLPAGASEVDVYLATTPPERLGSLLSTLALILLIGGALLRQILLNSRPEKPLATSLR